MCFISDILAATYKQESLLWPYIYTFIVKRKKDEARGGEENAV